MDFSSLMQAMTEQDGLWSAVVDDDWLQGRSVFGGLQAAIALKAMRALVAPEVPLRTLQVTFVAPVPAGKMSIRSKVLRRGKSATQVEGRIGEGDETLCVLLGVFGASRESVVRVLPTVPPLPTGKALDFRHIPGVTPNFTQYLPMRWLEGTPPFTNNPATRGVIEVNMQDCGPFSEGHLLAVADAPPPIALSMLSKFAAGSSMTWTIEILSQDLARQPLTGWRLDCEVVAARDGYTSQSVTIWQPDGALAAISRQSMVVFG